MQQGNGVPSSINSTDIEKLVRELSEVRTRLDVWIEMLGKAVNGHEKDISNLWENSRLLGERISKAEQFRDDVKEAIRISAKNGGIIGGGVSGLLVLTLYLLLRLFMLRGGF